jgi:hypothetical protein
MTAPIVTMREALSRPVYFGRQLGGDTWSKWRVLLIAIAGEPLTDDELVVFFALTNRQKQPEGRPREFWGVIGRRGGKSRAMAVLAAWLAGCHDFRDILAPGERGHLPVLAQTRDQATSAFNFICGVFAASSALRGLVDSRAADTLILKSGVDISTRAASFRSARGSTMVAAICDEIAFWRDDTSSANPDVEILRAIRPSLLTTGGPLIAISSPYAERGELWKAYSKHYGVETSKRLVAKASTLEMNSGVDREWIEEQFDDDPVAAEAEFNANFRTDVELFVSRAAIALCITDGVVERGPMSNTVYYGFADPSGGGPDTYTLAIAHRYGDKVVLDVIRERRLADVEGVTAEYAALLKAYGVGVVIGDNFAGEWPKQAFGRYGIEYRKADLFRSDLYLNLLPLINSRRVELLDHQKMMTQFMDLERRVGTSGRDSVNHMRGRHDDIVNAVAGALVYAERVPPPLNFHAPTAGPGRAEVNAMFDGAGQVAGYSRWVP